MLKEDLVSIIMPTYNSADFVEESIESILSQTYTNWELIITDDNSTDDTRLILQRYASEYKNIKYFFLYQNSGAGYCRNNSIKHAQGRYIAFCDSDDRWVPEKLERQVKFMHEKKCCLCYSSYYTCDEESNLNGIVKVPPKLTLKSMKHDNKIGCLTGIYDTSFFGKFYMPPIRKRQDWAMFLNIMKKCEVAYGITDPLAYYRILNNSISRNKHTLLKYNAEVYSSIFGYSKFKAYSYLYFMFMPSYMLKQVKNKYYSRKFKRMYRKKKKA
jgi:glycosyltransferase involved in cell wall biosynthesis